MCTAKNAVFIGLWLDNCLVKGELTFGVGGIFLGWGGWANFQMVGWIPGIPPISPLPPPPRENPGITKKSHPGNQWNFFYLIQTKYYFKFQMLPSP